GFGYSGQLALEPGFDAMVSRLQIGGVIPHYGSTSYERIRRTNRYLAGLTTEPLLICADIIKLAAGGRVESFGDGYVGGFIGRFSALPDDPFSTLAELNAFAFAALGVNVALGPTVDTSTRDPRTADRAGTVVRALRGYGIPAVLKHFPFLPAGANLHRESPDTKLPPTDAERRFTIFRDLASSADILMTTHLLDSAVDRTIVTFSPAWNSILRERTGYGGLLMTDGLLMLSHYEDRRGLAAGAGEVLRPADFPWIDEAARWAARAILAGHDMVIVEGSAAQTVRVFNGLLRAACGSSTASRALRERILQSAARIASWKADRGPALRRSVEVGAPTMARLIALLPPDGASDAALASFRFDAAGLAALQPAREAATAPR
ncbi:MAG TPA: glycoside hydrolase family 3 N-terminal domain-containing protein, partial [Spirochaetia bacterium]|nr:glycoside hydrolase family 3 N-terminal domain-containing protein [Spirochaetia bacterium]